MEELVKMLVDEGAIETGRERWTLHPRQAAGHPCAADADRRAAGAAGRPAAAERLALQQASVIGFVFWDQALAAIDPQAGLRCPRWCGASCSCRARTPSFEGVREYAFKHQILHHVTYDTVLKRTRRELPRQGGGVAGRL